MMNKTQLATSLYRQGKITEALRIAKGFRLGLTLEEHKAVVLAYECLIHPDFYRMVGVDIDQAIDQGKIIFAEKIAV